MEGEVGEGPGERRRAHVPPHPALPQTLDTSLEAQIQGGRLTPSPLPSLSMRERGDAADLGARTPGLKSLLCP